MYQPFPLQGTPKFTQSGIFGMKIYHLATLSITSRDMNPYFGRENDFSPERNKVKHGSERLNDMPWRRGAVDIASASGTRRPGFKSRQGMRFLEKHSSAVVYEMT
jgi:hypothetical protein